MPTLKRHEKPISNSSAANSKGERTLDELADVGLPPPQFTTLGDVKGQASRTSEDSGSTWHVNATTILPSAREARKKEGRSNSESEASLPLTAIEIRYVLTMLDLSTDFDVDAPMAEQSAEIVADTVLSRSALFLEPRVAG